MTIPPVAAVVARITDINARFGPQAFAGAQPFASVLQHAREVAGTAAPGGGAGLAPARAAPPEGLAGTAPAGGTPPAGGLASGDHAARARGTVAGPWAAGLPARGQPWAPAIEAAAASAGLDPALLASLVWAESAFDPGAVSHAGARGLAQLMPATARSLGVDIDDPVANLEGGARYLRTQLDRFGSLDLALAAYNAGPGRVAQAGGVPAIAETRAYVPRVLDHYARLQGAP